MSKLTIEEKEDIQGIILSGYGHLNHACYLFLHICNTAEAKRWLKKVTRETTTSQPWEKRDGKKLKPPTALNVAFTYSGLAALGLPQETLDSFAQEFIEGMVNRSEVLGDKGESASKHWEIGGPENEEIDVVLFLYAVDATAMDDLVDRQLRLIEETEGGIAEVSLQHGQRPDSGKEPFGFHDGISQPDIEGLPCHDPNYPSPPIKKGEFILGYLNEYGMYPVSPVVPIRDDPDHILPAFPNGALAECRDFGCHGTYVVYRKLEQHVGKFWQFMREQADGVPSAMKLLASKFIGRWPSGAPITLAPHADDPSLANENDFSFLPRDKEGYACPIGAHIRRANPRDALVNDTPADSFKTCSRHRLVRRGIPYGERAFEPAEVEGSNAPDPSCIDDGEPRGLHFIALNASIARQFEFLTQTWINDPTFAVLFNDKDPLVGNNDGSYFMTIQGKPIRRRISRIPEFITVKGGAYLFMPGMRALRYIASSSRDHDEQE
jgi:Dyp-type peroxidase family